MAATGGASPIISSSALTTDSPSTGSAAAAGFLKEIFLALLIRGFSTTIDSGSMSTRLSSAFPSVVKSWLSSESAISCCYSTILLKNI